MSEIALYNLLRRIPEATTEEVERAVADVAKAGEVATKGDIKALKAETKADIAEAKTTLIMWMVGVGLAVVGLIKYL